MWAKHGRDCIDTLQVHTGGKRWAWIAWWNTRGSHQPLFKEEKTRWLLRSVLPLESPTKSQQPAIKFRGSKWQLGRCLQTAMASAQNQLGRTVLLLAALLLARHVHCRPKRHGPSQLETKSRAMPPLLDQSASQNQSLPAQRHLDAKKASVSETLVRRGKGR